MSSPPTPTQGLVYLHEGYSYYCKLGDKAVMALSSTYNVCGQSFEDTTHSNNEKRMFLFYIKSQELYRIEENPSGLLRALCKLPGET